MTANPTMHETFTLGAYQERGRTERVDIEITIEDRNGKGLELSISGSEYSGATAASQRREESFGQITETARRVTESKLSRGQIDRLCDIWDRWHLNGMQAGCEHQRAAHWHICPGHYGYPGEDRVNCLTADLVPHVYRMEKDRQRQAQVFVKRLEREWNAAHALDIVTLEREPRRMYTFSINSYRCEFDMLSQPCPVCGYKYGSAWLHEELPESIISELRGIVAIIKA